MKFTYTGYVILGWCMFAFTILGGFFIGENIYLGGSFVALAIVCYLLRRIYRPWR